MVTLNFEQKFHDRYIDDNLILAIAKLRTCRPVGIRCSGRGIVVADHHRIYLGCIDLEERIKLADVKLNYLRLRVHLYSF